MRRIVSLNQAVKFTQKNMDRRFYWEDVIDPKILVGMTLQDAKNEIKDAIKFYERKAV